MAAKICSVTQHYKEREYDGSLITLWWGSGSPPCWRVMICLEEKGLKNYTSKLISFGAREHKGADIMAINPRGQVPTMRDNDLVLCESVAACEHLAEEYHHQGTALVPEDSTQRAKMRQRMHEVPNLADAQKGVSVAAREKAPEATMQAKQEALGKELAMWEAHLATSGGGGHFIAGEVFTVADAIFFPTLAFLVRMGLHLMPKFPELATYYNHMVARDSIKATWPPHWVDSPSQTILATM